MSAAPFAMQDCTGCRTGSGHSGLKGLAVAVASIIAALPDIVEELSNADGQRLVAIQGINPTRKRYRITDPRRDPPKYWPR